jgi:hypothetical protein
VFYILVGGEARAIGGDFEEDATWLMEVDGVEVEAVDDRRDIASFPGDLFVPLRLLFVVGGAECYVMHASDARMTTLKVGTHVQVNFGSGTTWAYFKDRDGGVLV